MMVALESKPGQKTSKGEGQSKGERVNSLRFQWIQRTVRFGDLWEGMRERYEVVFKEHGVKTEALEVLELLVMTRLRHAWPWGWGLK